MYFECEAHPSDQRLGYTAKLDTADLNNTHKFMLITGYGIGNRIRIVKASGRAKLGAVINTDTDDVSGCKDSLINNYVYNKGIYICIRMYRYNLNPT